MRAKMYLILGFLVNGIASLFAISFLIKGLNSPTYAYLSIAFTAISIISATSFQWLRVDLLRKLPVMTDSVLKEQYFSFFGIKIITCVVLVVLTAVLFNFHPFNSISDLLVYVLLAAVSQGLYELILIYFRAYDFFKSYALFNSLRAISWLFFVFVCYYFDLDLNFYLIFLFFAFAIPVILFFINHGNDIKIGLSLNLPVIVGSVKKSALNMINVASPLVLIFLLKVFVSNNGHFFDHRLVKNFDFIYLVAGMFFTAVNLMYQTTLVRNFDINSLSVRNSSHAFLTFLVAPASCLIFFYIFKSAFLREFSLLSHLTIVNNNDIGCLFLFVIMTYSKSHWLDHAFYLKKNYLALSVTYLVPLVFFCAGYVSYVYYRFDAHYFVVLLLFSAFLSSALSVLFEYRLLKNSMFLYGYMLMILFFSIILGVVNV